MGLFSSIGALVGRNNKVNAPATPDYYTDPNFEGTQSFLKNYAEKLLAGDIPDYYKSIGMTSDQAAGVGLMNDYVSQATSDILKNDLEAGALTGRGRTGLSSDALGKAGLMGGALRYQDYVRAMQGKQWLMDTGLGQEGDVREAGAWNQAAKNQFGQWKYGMDLAQEQRRAEQANAASAKRWGAVDDIAGMVLAPATGGASLANTSYATGGADSYIQDLLSQILGGSKKKRSLYSDNEGVTSSDFGNISMKGGLAALGLA